MNKESDMNILDIVQSLDYTIRTKEIQKYKTSSDKCPYDIWLENLDKSVQARIIKRIDRVSEGNFGDCKNIGSDISELRFDFGSGYRIYFSEFGNIVVILLCGGDKSTQAKDIEKAKEYVKDLKERLKNGN